MISDFCVSYHPNAYLVAIIPLDSKIVVIESTNLFFVDFNSTLDFCVLKMTINEMLGLF